MLANQLVVDNLKLADICAKKWRKSDPSIEYDDYFQTACLGLISSSRKWKPNKSKFSSYAYMAMDGEVKDMRAKLLTGIKDGFSKARLIPKWIGLQEELLQAYSYTHDFDIEVPDIEIESFDAEKQNQLRLRLNNIKEQMAERKLTITALAKKIKISQPTLSRWLTADIKLDEGKFERMKKALEET